MSGNAVAPIYTICVDSNNRQENGPDPANPTNNITIPSYLPQTRMPITQMYVGSTELKLRQQVVEPLWNRVYFNEDGVALIGNTSEQESIRMIQVSINGIQYTAELPLYLNAVVHVDSTTPTAPIFTTEFPHDLALANEWNWGQPIRLISTPLSDLSSDTILGSANPKFRIIDDNMFQLVGIAPTVFTATNGVYGYVYAPPIPSPTDLARIVQKALQITFQQTKFLVSYDSSTGLFSIQYISPSSRSCVNPPPVAQDTVILHVVYNSLASLMGFGPSSYAVIPVANSTTIVNMKRDTIDCKTPLLCPPGSQTSLTGPLGLQCFSTLTVTPGNYNMQTLSDQLSFQLNRFYFNPQCSGDPYAEAVFVFSNAEGTCIDIPIPYGLYNPDTFASYLQSQMDAHDGLSNTYNVTWVPSTSQTANGTICGTFVFSSVNETPFGLEFGSTPTTFNAAILGFEQVNYRGATSYTSTNTICVPVKSCCQTSSIPVRYLSHIYQIQLNLSEQKIEILPTNLKPISGTATFNVTVLGVTTTYAHGFQVEDIIALRVNGTGITYWLRVVSVTGAFSFAVDVGSASALTTLVNEPVTVSLQQVPEASLLLALPRPAQLPNRFLGFPDQDILWPTLLKSVYSMDVHNPNYLLLVMDAPVGATHTNHPYKRGQNVDNIFNVFAKVVLFPEFRLDRSFPMNMYLPVVETIPELKFRWLNPDHTPYQFHGCDWSMTLCVIASESQVALMCG